MYGSTIVNSASITCNEQEEPTVSNIASFTVISVITNEPPTLDSIANQTIIVNTETQTVTLTGISAGDADDAGQALTLTAASSNIALIPTPTVQYISPNPTGTLTFTPVTGKTGTAVLTVTVQDDRGTANGGVNTTVRTFTITVIPINDAPTLKSIPNLTLTEDTPKTISLTGISAGKVGQVVAVTAASSNPALLPTLVVNYTAPKSTGTLTLAPTPGASGTAVIILTVKDDGGTLLGGKDTTSVSFTVTVNAVNDAPTLDAIPNQQLEDTGQPLIVPLTGIGPGGNGEKSGQTVSVSATSSNTQLLPAPVISGTGATRTLTLQPSAGKHGTVTVTVLVKDDGGTVNGGKNTTKRTFSVSILHHQPDLWMNTSSESSFNGKGLFNTDGAKQTKTQAIAALAAATYQFAVQNAGTGADTFTVVNRGNATGWAVQYFLTDAKGTVLAPINSDFTGCGWATGLLAAGQGVYFKAVFTSSDPAAAPCTLQLVATSATNPLHQDVVTTVTTRK